MTSQRTRILSRAGWQCEARDLVPHITCWPASSRALQLHHVKNRSQGGTNDDDNLRAVCGTHHNWITEHPADAHEVGLTRWSWE